MKILITIAIALSLPFVVRADEPHQVGRYQLLYAVTSVATASTVYDEKRGWKIDTVTGQVWYYLTTNIKGQPKDAFVPVHTLEVP